jgi:hypothetical protein
MQEDGKCSGKVTKSQSQKQNKNQMGRGLAQVVEYSYHKKKRRRKKLGANIYKITFFTISSTPT